MAPHDDRTVISRAVRRLRVRLRTRVLWGTALTVLVPLLPVLVASSAFPPIRALAWGLGLAVLLVTLARKSQQLPDDRDAARWLDERLKARGLIVAAHHCTAQERDDVQAQAVLTEAGGLLAAQKLHRLTLPWQPLALRGGLAVALAALVWGVLVVLPAVSRVAGVPGTPGMATSLPTSAEEAQQALESRLDPQTAEQLRQHPQMAALAEQAMASGDLEGLKDLLDQLPAPGGEQPQASAPSPAPAEKPRTAQDPQPPQAGPPNGQPPAQQPVSGSNKDGGVPPPPGSPGNAQPQDNPPSDPSAASGEQTRTNKAGSSQAPETEAPSPGGKGTGAGHSDGKQGQVADKGGTKSQVKSADPFSASLFEIKLPGKDATMSLQQALAATQRSAEAALQSSSTPLEYESAVRDYFLTLSHKEQP